MAEFSVPTRPWGQVADRSMPERTPGEFDDASQPSATTGQPRDPVPTRAVEDWTGASDRPDSAAGSGQEGTAARAGEDRDEQRGQSRARWRDSMPARGTLTRSLIMRAMIIIMAMALLLGGIATLVARQTVLNQLDTRLAGIANRQSAASHNPGEDLPGGVDLPGQSVGTAVVEVQGNVALHGRMTEHGVKPIADPQDVATLSQQPVDGDGHTVTLPGLGSYRAHAVEVEDRKIVVALPLAPTNALLTQMLAVLTLLSISVLVVGGGTVYLLVVRHLRPVTDLAATAREVSGMDLERGTVNLVRAPVPAPGHADEVAEVATAFNQMLGHVESALKARQVSEMRVRQFVADVSHELRNPLAAMRGYSELTRRDRHLLPNPHGLALERIDAESERMSTLVQDLLLLARLDNNPQQTVNEPVDMSELIVAASMDARVSAPDHVWTLDLAPEPVFTYGDRHQLHQMVSNLLANASTHTPAGSTIRVALRGTCGSPSEASAVLTVQDNGPGIPAANLATVFDRFVRGDANRTRHQEANGRISTGLGLSIVAAVVNAHNGTVTVDSYAPRDEDPDWDPARPGARQGWTTFTVRLPRHAPEPQDREGAPQHASGVLDIESAGFLVGGAEEPRHALTPTRAAAPPTGAEEPAADQAPAEHTPPEQAASQPATSSQPESEGPTSPQLRADRSDPAGTEQAGHAHSGVEQSGPDQSGPEQSGPGQDGEAGQNDEAMVSTHQLGTIHAPLVDDRPSEERG